MQIPSTPSSKLSNVPLSLQTSALRGNRDPAVVAVGQHQQSQEDMAQAALNSPPSANLDPSTDKKLSRIKEVQIAFQAALNIANSIESQYLLEPIV